MPLPAALQQALAARNQPLDSGAAGGSQADVSYWENLAVQARTNSAIANQLRQMVSAGQLAPEVLEGIGGGSSGTVAQPPRTSSNSKYSGSSLVRGMMTHAKNQADYSLKANLAKGKDYGQYLKNLAQYQSIALANELMGPKMAEQWLKNQGYSDKNYKTELESRGQHIKNVSQIADLWQGMALFGPKYKKAMGDASYATSRAGVERVKQFVDTTNAPQAIMQSKLKTKKGAADILSTLARANYTTAGTQGRVQKMQIDRALYPATYAGKVAQAAAAQARANSTNVKSVLDQQLAAGKIDQQTYDNAYKASRAAYEARKATAPLRAPKSEGPIVSSLTRTITGRRGNLAMAPEDALQRLRMWAGNSPKKAKLAQHVFTSVFDRSQAQGQWLKYRMVQGRKTPDIRRVKLRN